jgi:quercetin dioxygenase-like cupin family protein
MVRSAFFAALVVCSVVFAEAPRLPAPEDALVATVADAKWAGPKNAEIPTGALVSPVAAEPATGASVGYAKFPSGYLFPAHWHSHTEYTVVVSGKVTFTIGGKAHALLAGSYVVIPAKEPHQVRCEPGAECLLLTRRAGPTDYHWVGR